jgi:DUF4097 and DUF4098 domain-containing protein YvlB
MTVFTMTDLCHNVRNLAPRRSRVGGRYRNLGSHMSGRTVELVLVGAMVGTVMAGTLVAQVHKELHFNVGARANVSVRNPYGAISVKPSQGGSVVVNAILASDKVEVDSSQTGSRVDIQSHLLPGATEESGHVDYEILVPADTSVSLHSNTGPMHAEGLHGDMTLEGAEALVDVRDITNAHVHVKTLNGPVTLTNVIEGHVEVDSLSGSVTLNRVTGPLVQVISTSGVIHYTGDFGDGGEYRLTSHSGDIDATVPDTTSADVSASSVRGEVHDDIPLQPKTHTSYIVREGSAFVGTMGRAAASSTVVLRSFSGKIHLRKRTAK